MDIRGVEITNQLRSAIRAKLLELGVRYDEELPDYILVMVVNKKSRQQMNEDLNLFLEDSTESFVNWLHDQVLKKLQKVTIAKKKSSKDIAPTSIVKKEEDQKEVKVEDDSHTPDRKYEVPTKKERDREFEELVGDLALLNDEGSKDSIDEEMDENKSQKKKAAYSSFELNNIGNITSDSCNDDIFSSAVISPSSEQETVFSAKSGKHDSHKEKFNESSFQNKKRISDVGDTHSERDSSSAKRTRMTNDSDKEEDRERSSASKPKITSVVSVKTSLGNTSPLKRSESHNKTSSSSRHSSSSHKSVDRRRQHSEESRDEHKNERSSYSSFANEKSKTGDLREKVRLSKANTIKSRLGSDSHNQDKTSSKPSSSSKISKPRISNVRSRLGMRSEPQNKNPQDIRTRLLQMAQGGKHFEEDDTESVINTSLRSQVIAVQPPTNVKSKSRSSKISKQLSALSSQEAEDQNKVSEGDKNQEEEEEEEQCKVPSKIIVTPRPLKPLQPSQRRATQSLLLKAVAEANQSVVMKKKVDPCLKEQTSTKNIKITRDLRKGKILSVQLNNAKKRVLDKIQVELKNPDLNTSKQPRKYSKLLYNDLSNSNVLKSRITYQDSSKTKADESLDVVKSLFNRSDDKQKFLVTLNGYNNNILRERNSDDEERLEMEVNEDDEFNFIANPYESYVENDEAVENLDFDLDQDNYAGVEYQETDYIEEATEENDNSHSENYTFEEYSEKKRSKLSPIVYTRSHSNSPLNKSVMIPPTTPIPRTDKKPLVSSVITTLPDKSSEKCRYWPNCTLGVKCAYYHPDVPCSAFPACKFGDKCAYKHPKCKFGSSCSKSNCIFGHPPVQCKYHPYCMKPGCPFSHPKTTTPLSPLDPLPDVSSVKAKFTWKRKD